MYDASAKPGGKGVSLNDCLHVGPALTPMLYDVLIRFREKRVAVVGGIEKAFLNVEMAEKTGIVGGFFGWKMSMPR